MTLLVISLLPQEKLFIFVLSFLTSLCLETTVLQHSLFFSSFPYSCFHSFAKNLFNIILQYSTLLSRSILQQNQELLK